MSVLCPDLGDEFPCVEQCSLSYKAPSCVFRELELLIVLPSVNVIPGAALTQAGSKRLVLQLCCGGCVISLAGFVDYSLLPP